MIIVKLEGQIYVCTDNCYTEWLILITYAVSINFAMSYVELCVYLWMFVSLGVQKVPIFGIQKP